MPTDNGFWLKDLQRIQDCGRQAIEPAKYQAIDLAKNHPLRRSTAQNIVTLAISRGGEPSSARRVTVEPRRSWALAKAAEAFWKHAYAATSLDDLVAATGMNRPSLYAAFGDQRDLYLKTLTRYQQQWRAISEQITAGDRPLRVFLARFYEAALDIYLESGDEVRGCYSISTAPAQAVTVATAVLHTIAVRARVGVPRKQLRAVAAAAIDVICGPQKS